MIALLQRVSQASVTVEGSVIGSIDVGLLVFVCAERDDNEKTAERLLAKLLTYRVFADDAGKMNRSVRDVSGQLLLVSQFTLAADTKSGTRPSFTPAAPPELGRHLYEHFVSGARLSADWRVDAVQTGEFGADMQVALVNDGPVTFWLRVAPG
jgi:D-tyrosyl-tRNA(Tyr) deacylase